MITLFLQNEHCRSIKPLNIGNYKNETRGPKAELVHRSNATSRKDVTRRRRVFSKSACVDLPGEHRGGSRRYRTRRVR